MLGWDPGRNTAADWVPVGRLKRPMIPRGPISKIEVKQAARVSLLRVLCAAPALAFSPLGSHGGPGDPGEPPGPVLAVGWGLLVSPGAVEVLHEAQGAQGNDGGADAGQCLQLVEADVSPNDANSRFDPTRT